MNTAPQVNTIANWYGSDRTVAERIALELKGYPWVGVPCAGGMGILRFVTARSILVGDLHVHLINMARVLCDPVLGPKMYRSLRRKIMHPVELELAQERCVARERMSDTSLFFPTDATPPVSEPDLQWAIDYAVCSWMGQGGRSGEAREFDGGLSFRWDAGGGGSAKRFQNWVSSLPAWRRVMRHCEFVVMDVFEFLKKLKSDSPDRALYLDPPWPDAGLKYRHPFTERQQRLLCAELSTFKQTRVVVRYGDHPLIRELYGNDHWTIIEQGGRDQANQDKQELLIVNGKSFVNAESVSSDN